MIQSHTQIKFKEFSFQLRRVSSHFKSKLTDHAAIFNMSIWAKVCEECDLVNYNPIYSKMEYKALLWSTQIILNT